MARVWRFFAARGLDVLIVLAAAGGALGTLLRDDADKPAGVQLWLEVVAVTCIPLLLLGRKRWPLVAPAAVWITSAALSFVDHQLITTQPSVYLAGMGAAVLLGGLRSAVEARVGLAVVLVSAAIVIAHDPPRLLSTWSSAPRSSAWPGSWGTRSVPVPNAARWRRSGRCGQSGTASRRPGWPWQRSGPGWPESSTTSSPTL